MAADNYRKIKLLKLMELLRQDTDEQHPMKKTDICARMCAMGIQMDVRTLGRDVRVLRSQGYEIMEVMISHDKAYYIADRNFSVPELKILIDAVQAATFIPQGKSDELISKIAALAGSNEAEVLTGSQICFNTRKHSNEAIYYNVLFLEAALRQQKKASFCYFDLNEWREKVYRKNHERYLVDPIALVYTNDNYYLMCDSEKHKGITNYRLDRMDSVAVEEDAASDRAQAYGQEVAQYTGQVFKMFGGEPKNVTLEFDDDLIGPVFDKFGEGIAITRSKDDKCQVKVQVQVSRLFFGWIFQFAGKMRIVGPKSVRTAFEDQINKLLESRVQTE